MSFPSFAAFSQVDEVLGGRGPCVPNLVHELFNLFVNFTAFSLQTYLRENEL